MYTTGVDSCAKKSQQAALEFREKENELIRKLDEANQKREVIYRDKIHVVQGAADPSGCLDVAIPDAVRMQLSGGDKAKP